MDDAHTLYDEHEYWQEWQVYIDSIKKQDFHIANTLANRMMSNAWLFDKKKFGIMAFLQKQLAMIGLNAPNSESKNNIASLVLDNLHTISDHQVMNDLDLKSAWNAFSKTFKETRDKFLQKQEIEYYKITNPEITASVIKKLGIMLLEEKEQLEYKQNGMLITILSEIARYAHIYGITEKEIRIWSLLEMISNIYEFVIMAPNDTDFKNRVQDEIYPLVDKFIFLMNNYSDEAINDYLWDMIKTWRFYFIKFTEYKSADSSIIVSGKENYISITNKSNEKEVVN